MTRADVLQNAFQDDAVRGPHARANRWVYRVPKGREARAELLFVRVQRITAATTPGIVEAKISFKSSAGSPVILVAAKLITNGVGDLDSAVVGSDLSLLGGDEVTAQTSDRSIGGQCDYILSAKILESEVKP